MRGNLMPGTLLNNEHKKMRNLEPPFWSFLMADVSEQPYYEIIKKADYTSYYTFIL